MDRRLELQALLESLVPSPGKVYFQPPSNVTMIYPCIVYERNFAKVHYAANGPYNRVKRYTVTVIDRDPDSAIPDLVAALPMSSFSRHFASENLNHDAFDLYF